jgi:hypothetical protein
MYPIRHPESVICGTVLDSHRAGAGDLSLNELVAEARSF